jgi:hypothetical protein
MKKLSLILSLALAFSIQSTAQTYKIDTTEITFENKLRPCLEVKYDAPPKTVKKAWDSFFGKYYNVKIKGIGFLTNKDVITGTDVTIAAVSDKRMDLYARITDVAGGSELKYFMSFGYDFFIGPGNYPTEFGGMKKILNDFSVEFLTDFYGSEATDITKKIKGLEKDISKNDRSIKKNNRKAKKGSNEVASGLQAKNTSLQMENEQIRKQIDDLGKEIENIKVKQAGISRN